jgi:penicillin-insensitive murein endopeptidase
MHIRISCPKGSTNCRAQPAVSGDDGCGAEIAGWLKKIAPPKTPPKAVAKPEKPEPKKPDIMLADLPTECRTVLAAGESTPATAPPTATSGTAPNDAPKGARKKTAARK